MTKRLIGTAWARGLGLFALLLVVGGCAQDAGLEEELVAASNRVAELEQAVGELRTSHEQEVNRLRSNARIERQEYVNTINQLRTEVKNKAGLVTGLEKTLRDTRAEVRQLREDQRREETLATIRSEAEVAEEVGPAPAGVVEGFPLRVVEVEAEKIIEGVRVHHVEKPAGAAANPDDPNEPQVEQEKITEYGYQVRFTLKNPTKDRLTVSVSAGKSTSILNVRAYGVTASTISAEKGAPLSLTIKDNTADFPVTY